VSVGSGLWEFVSGVDEGAKRDRKEALYWVGINPVSKHGRCWSSIDLGRCLMARGALWLRRVSLNCIGAR
jgi:hypothetical protein